MALYTMQRRQREVINLEAEKANVFISGFIGVMIFMCGVTACVILPDLITTQWQRYTYYGLLLVAAAVSTCFCMSAIESRRRVDDHWHEYGVQLLGRSTYVIDTMDPGDQSPFSSTAGLPL